MWPATSASAVVPDALGDAPSRIYDFHNHLDEDDLDEADRLSVTEQLEALLNLDLDDAEQFERWTRIKKLEPGLMSSGQQIIETVSLRAAKAQLGLQ